MPRVASRQSANPFVVVGVWYCQCLVVVVFQTRSTWFHCIACEHFVAPLLVYVSDVLFNEILIPTNLHLVRNLIACNVAVHLVHPDADPFYSQEIALLRMLSGTAAAGPAAGTAAAPSDAVEKLSHRSLW